jgi:Tol biopolymer transport system component
VWPAITLVLLVGCYQPDVPVGVRCSQSGECPAGQLCDQVRGTCGGAPSDAPPDSQPDAPIDAIAFGPWSAPLELTEVNSAAQDTDPSISTDGLELFFASYRTGVGSSDLWHTTRPSLTAPFAPPALVVELATVAEESAPEISGDGLTLYFRRANDIFRATRATKTSPFGIAVMDAELSSAVRDTNPAISDNGLFASVTLEPTATERELYLFTRASTTAPWGVPRQLTELSTPLVESAASLSNDGLQLWFHSDRNTGPGGATDLFLATRASVATLFVAAPVVELNTAAIESDPSLTGDLRMIVFERDQNLMIATR